MKESLFKNFKSLKEKEDEKKISFENLDNVSVSSEKNKTVIEEGVGVGKSNMIKKHPLKKEIIEAKKIISHNNIATYVKRNEINVDKRTFTVFLKNSSFEFIKDLVFYKVTTEHQIFFSQSEAFMAALNEEKPFYKNMTPRPDYIKEQEKARKGGRKRNSDEVYDSTTTVYIPESYYDFIKDVTYNKVILGDMYFKDWDLIEEGIQKLKSKYGENIKPRPDYIREEELQRGKKKIIKT